MMNSVRLVASKEIARDELITSLLQMGVQRDESPHRIWDYQLLREEASVWVDLDSLENYPAPDVDPLIESLLGGPPCTYIVLQISGNPGSEQLALELAIRIATRWPFVLDNLSGLARRIFTRDELQSLYDRSLGLREDEKGVPMPKEWYTTDEEYIAPWQQKELEQQNADTGSEKQGDLP